MNRHLSHIQTSEDRVRMWRMSCLRAFRILISMLIIPMLIGCGGSGWDIDIGNPFGPNVPQYPSGPYTGPHFNDVSFSDANHGWAVADGGRVARTTDGGITWAVERFGITYFRSVSFSTGTSGFAVGDTHGAIFRTVDGGGTWETQTIEPPDAALFGVTFVDEFHGWVVGYDLSGEEDVILQTIDGETWTRLSTPTYLGLQDIAFVGLKAGWAVGLAGSIVRTKDGGETWDVLNSGTNKSLRAVDFVSPNQGWTVGYQGTILNTVDGGETWVVQGEDIDGLGELRDVDFVNEQEGWAVGSTGVIIHTSDGGVTWTIQDHSRSVCLNGVHFADERIGWAVGDGRTILHTSDGGRHWQVQAVPSGE